MQRVFEQLFVNLSSLRQHSFKKFRNINLDGENNVPEKGLCGVLLLVRDQNSFAVTAYTVISFTKEIVYTV